MGQHGAHLGRQDPSGPHFGSKNLAIWVYAADSQLIGNTISSDELPLIAQ